MRSRGRIDAPAAAKPYLAKCIAGDDLPVALDEIDLVGAFRGPTGKVGHLLYGWGETRHLVLVVDLTSTPKIVGDYTFDLIADYGLYDLPKPARAMKPTAVARVFKHGAKVVRRKRPKGSGYEVRIWGPADHVLLRGLDDVFNLTFEPKHAHELAGALANPALAKVESFGAQDIDFVLPTEPELWPDTLRNLHVTYKRRGKHALAVPPVENLESLFAASCTVPDLRGLSSLTQLQRLYLSDCDVGSLNGLQELPRIRSLTIHNDTGRSALRDISAISALTDLEELWLTHAIVSDLEALSGLRKLRKLELYGLPNIESVAPLGELTGLRELRIHGCDRIESLEPLQPLKKLERLGIVIHRPRKKDVFVRSRRELERLLTKPTTTKKAARKTAKTGAKKTAKATRKALVFRLDELSALPDLIDVCCHVARGGQRHRPADEYLQYTYVVASGSRPVKLPKEDPSIPVDDEFPPGFMLGLLTCLQDLPRLERLVRPRNGELKCFVASHCTATPQEIAEHLTATGYEVLGASDLLPDGSPIERESWRPFEEAATAELGPALAEHLRDQSTPPPSTLPSAKTLDLLPLKQHDPEHWDERDRRAAKLLVSLGSPQSLLLDIGAYSWASPERLHEAWVEAMREAGLPETEARAMLLAHEVSKSISPGFSDSLSLLARRESLAELAEEDPALKSQLRFGLGRAIKVIVRNTGAQLPTTKLLTPFQ